MPAASPAQLARISDAEQCAGQRQNRIVEDVVSSHSVVELRDTTRPRATIRSNPKGRRMPKLAIYQRKVDGKWAVIELPDDYKDGDRLPLRGSTTQWFDSRDEARAELLSRATQD